MAKSGAPELIGNPFRHEHTYIESRNNTLSEFSSIYPFDIIKSMEYYRPSSAMIISMSAAQNGGALVFTTKDGSDIKDKKQDLFIREFKPLGYNISIKYVIDDDVKAVESCLSSDNTTSAKP